MSHVLERIRVLGQAGSDVLCQHGHETLPAGSGFEGVLPSTDRDNYADVHNSFDTAVQDGDRQVPKRPSQLPSSKWSSWLWSGWREDKHLRHVRDEMAEGNRQRSRHDSMSTQGGTNCKDAFVQERIRHGQDHCWTPSRPPQRKFLKWLFPTFMASACLKHAGTGGGSIGEIVQAQVKGSSEVPRSSTDCPYRSKPKLAGMSEQEIIEMQAELEYMRRQGAQQGSHMDVEEENWDDWDEEDPQAWFHREQDFPAGYEVPPVPEQGSEEEF